MAWAANADQAKAVAASVKELAEALKSAKNLTDQLVENNQALSINWNNPPTGLVDETGLIVGTNYTPGQISNAIGSLAAFQALWAAGHGGNFELLAKPIV